MLGWINDMLGMTEQLYKDSTDDEQFRSAMRAMVVVSTIMFKAGYFSPSVPLFQNNICMSYLGIDCDTKYGRFLVPQARIETYEAMGHDPGRHRNMPQNSDLIIFLKKIVLKSLRVAIFAKMAAKFIKNSM